MRISLIVLSAILVAAAVGIGPVAAQSPDPSLSPSFLPLASGDPGLLTPSLDRSVLADGATALDPALLEDPTAAALRPDESFPSLSGLLAGLAASDPALAPLADAGSLVDGLQAELFREIRAKVAPDGSVGPLLASIGGAVPARMTSSDVEVPASFAFDGASFAVVVYLFELLGGLVHDKGAVKEGLKFTKSVTEGDTTGTIDVEFGAPGADNRYGFTVEKDGVKYSGRISGHTTGDRCPDADGKVRMEFTAGTQAAGGKPGASVATAYEVKGTATAMVDDSAYITGDIAMDVTGSYTHTGGGHNAYVEGGMSATFKVDDWSSPETIRQTLSSTQSEMRDIRVSQHATSAIDGVEAAKTILQATAFAFTMLQLWQATWRDGHSCVRVQGTIPQLVKVSSATPIDLKVVHRDGQPLDQPIEGTLSGTKSIGPTRLEHAPGTVTCTAGDKPGKRADLTFTSTSRRGIGKLEGAVWTEDKVSYVPRSIPGVRTWKGGCIDALDRGPIVLTWKDETPGANTKGTFTLDPTSATEGTLTEVKAGKGTGWSFSYKGKGHYDVNVFVSDPDGSPKELQIAYSTTGKMRQCVGSRCTTSKVDGGEAFIPVVVVPGSCPAVP